MTRCDFCRVRCGSSILPAVHMASGMVVCLTCLDDYVETLEVDEAEEPEWESSDSEPPWSDDESFSDMPMDFDEESPFLAFSFLSLSEH